MSKVNFVENWGIVGHENLVNFLKGSITNNKVSHAYLLAAPAGLGKRKVAESFIAALLCLKPIDGCACQKCVNCEQLKKNIHPDVSWIERLTDEKTGKLKKNITIEQVREIKNKLSLGSFLNSYKIAVIAEASLLNQEGANALLKLLEEPADKVVIILLSERPDYLPQTILSRCQQLRLEFVSRELIYDYLTELGAGRTLADELSSLALGRPGVAVGFFRDKERWEKYQNEARDFLQLVAADEVTRLKVAEELTKTGAGDDLISKIKFLSGILDVWAGLIRDAILIKNSRQEAPDGLANLWLLNKLKTAKLLTEDSATLNSWLKRIEETKKLFKNNINPQLALESLVLSLG